MIMISPKFPEHGIRGFVCGGHTHLHDSLVEGEHSHEHVHEKGGIMCLKRSRVLIAK